LAWYFFHFIKQLSSENLKNSHNMVNFYWKHYRLWYISSLCEGTQKCIRA